MNTNLLDSIDPKIIGERLADARRARRLTQQQAATTLGVARTTITAIEQGVRRPRAAELRTLAHLYGRQVGDLVRPTPDQHEPSFVVQFQAARGPANTVPDAGRDADIQQFENLCRWYVELETMVGAPLPRRYPDLYDIAGTIPERAAEDVATAERHRLGLGDGPIGDLAGILEADVGLRIFAIPMTNQRVAGMFLFSETYGGCIAVNANHPEEQRRSTIAHAYAHFLTNARHQPEIIVHASYQRTPEGERFAEAFARNFLMPATGLSRRFHGVRRTKDKPLTSADMLTLSHLYRVSLQNMVDRLEELKLLPSGTWTKLSAAEIRTSNTRPITHQPDVEPERPVLPLRYERLAAQAYQEALLSEGQLARRLLTDRVSAALRVRQLTEETRLSKDGEWYWADLDLNAVLVGEP